MVRVDEGIAIITGDALDVSLDIVCLLSTINKIKRNDYKGYLVLEANLKALLEEEPEFIDVIKEFAINMTELFN